MVSVAPMAVAPLVLLRVFIWFSFSPLRNRFIHLLGDAYPPSKQNAKI